jgi:hypothetical protein
LTESRFNGEELIVMATAAQIEANRQNARKSTGPRTEEGKNRSRLNALDHGGRANLMVLPTEVFGEYEMNLSPIFGETRERHRRGNADERGKATGLEFSYG